MGQPVSRSICCSVREKDGKRPMVKNADSPQFHQFEVGIALEKPRLTAFAPLWHTGIITPRRLAIAGERIVHVYSVSDGAFDQSPALVLEHTLQLEDGMTVTALQFRDEDSSRTLAVAYGPSHEGTADDCRIRLWACDGNALNWSQNEGFITSLDAHTAPISHLAVSSTFLLSADKSGMCHVWVKNRGFALRTSAQLHQNSGFADLVVDRLYAYSIGDKDPAVCVWAMPDLNAVLSIRLDTMEGLPWAGGGGFPRAATPGLQGGDPACLLSSLSALRRPTSRWSGSQGSTRHAGVPRGMLFVAGVLAEGSGIAGQGGAVLMEWTLGAHPSCQSAQMAHDSPIVAMAYGPYDNGPLITADGKAVFRVWDYTPRLWCSQQIDLGSAQHGNPRISISVDPLNRALYTSVGEKRLYLWRQHGIIEPLCDQA